MRVDLLLIENLTAQLPTMKREDFVAQYPCFFVVPMGFLSIEAQSTNEFRDAELTMPINLSALLKHDTKQNHPLAGCVFALYSKGKDLTSATIGRSSECDITVPETSISERHCALAFRGNSIYLVDFESTNGTMVNRVPIKSRDPIALKPEDLFTVGRYSFQFHSSGSLHTNLSLLEMLRSK